MTLNKRRYIFEDYRITCYSRFSLHGYCTYMHDNEDHVHVCCNVNNDPNEPMSEGRTEQSKKAYDLDKFYPTTNKILGQKHS